jgi:uncharacterized membrane protein
MSTNELVSIALAVLSPILAAALGIVGLVVGDWHQRRTDAGRRKVAFEDASRQVAFATEWWNARKQLADSPEAEQQATSRAVAWLEEASERIVESTPPQVDDRPTITMRRLLLAYPMESRSAWVFRGAFYMCLSFVFLSVAGAIDSAFRPETIGATTYFFGAYFYSDIITIVVLTVVAMVLRWWAMGSEREAASREKPGRTTLPRALLLYRFHRRGAKIVRIIFYVSAAFSFLWAAGVVVSFFDDLRSVPLAVCWFLVSLGYTAGIRNWAASLEQRTRSRPDSAAAAPATIDPSQAR